MKNNRIWLVFVFLFSVLIMGCPQFGTYPLGKPGKEIADAKLTGVWSTEDTASIIQRMEFISKDDFSFEVKILNPGEGYSSNIFKFSAWTTNISGQNLISAQELGDKQDTYYYAKYTASGKKLSLSFVGMNMEIGGQNSKSDFERVFKYAMKETDFFETPVIFLKEKI